MLAFGFEREVNDQDSVFLHDSNQQDDADDRYDAELLAKENQGQKSAHAGRRQSGEDRDGMNEAFIEDAEHDVDRDQRRQDQKRLIGQRINERSGGALERGLEAGREMDISRGLVDIGDGLPERGIRGEIEGDGNGRELSLMIDAERFCGGGDVGKRIERHNARGLGSRRGVGDKSAGRG